MAATSDLDWSILSYEDRTEVSDRLASRALALKSPPHGPLPATTIHGFFDGDLELPGRDVDFLIRLARENRLRIRQDLFALARGYAAGQVQGRLQLDVHSRPAFLKISVTAGALVSIVGVFGILGLYFFRVASDSGLYSPFLLFFALGISLLLVSIAIEVWRDP